MRSGIGTYGYQKVLSTISRLFGPDNKKNTADENEGSVTELTIKPPDPSIGDVMEIYGKGTPDSEIDILVSFEKELSVNEGRYFYEFDRVKIPEGSNRYTVKGIGVEDLNFTVKMFVMFTRTSHASDGVAVFSDSNVPAGTYDIRVDGKALDNRDRVTIVVEAVQTIRIDEDGSFNYSYDTSSLVGGAFKVKAGNIVKDVFLNSKEEHSE